MVELITLLQPTNYFTNFRAFHNEAGSGGGTLGYITGGDQAQWYSFSNFKF
jgi:hypothetical protein